MSDRGARCSPRTSPPRACLSRAIRYEIRRWLAMLAPKTLSLGRSPLLWLAGGVGALFWLMLPAGVTVMNDDFGYVGSVVETIQRGRPWTDEWLAPWSASLAVCSALLFKLTGSFLVATQGLQAAGVAGAAALAYLLFRDRALAPRAAAVAVFLAL